MHSRKSPPVYTLSYFCPFCLISVVFVCFMSSLFVLCRICFCLHDTTDSSIIPFPVRMWHLYFRFPLILLQTFDVSSHLWGWCNCTKVFRPKLHQWGMTLGLATIVLALALHLHLVCWWIFSFFFGVDGFALPLLTWGLSTNPVHLHSHVFICYGLGFISIFFNLSAIFA